MPTKTITTASVSGSRIAAPFLVLVLAAACGGRPTPEEVIDRTMPAVCAKAEACAAAEFFDAFPNGHTECVSVTKAEAVAKYGEDPDKTSACTDGELDQCLQALEASACIDDVLLPRLPCSC